MCEYINGAIIQEDFNMEKYILMAVDHRQAEHLSGQHQRAGNRANAPPDETDGRA